MHALAILDVLVARSPSPGLADRLEADGDLHAPHLVDVEVLHALRRLSLDGDITDDRAADARTDFAELALVRYPHRELGNRIWALRHNLTAHDAAFAALAELLAVPLVTCDARLARAPGLAARVELFGPSSR